MASVLLAGCFMLVSCLAFSPTPRNTIFSSETSVGFHRTTRRYIPEDITFTVIVVSAFNPTIPRDVIIWLQLRRYRLWTMWLSSNLRKKKTIN
jgi:hypothetical protein